MQQMQMLSLERAPTWARLRSRLRSRTGCGCLPVPLLLYRVQPSSAPIHCPSLHPILAQRLSLCWIPDLLGIIGPLLSINVNSL